MSLTTADTRARADRSFSDQIQYNQNAVDNHGQSDGVWRNDCSGMICAIFNLQPEGIGCYSTYELAHHNGVTGAPYDDRRKAIPYKTVTLVTNEDGFPFGHVALVIGYNASTDQLVIQEHGGGVGPDRRTLPSGVNYDSDRQYGRHRNFRLWDLEGVTVPPPPPPKPAPTTHAFPFPANEYFGDINGPAISHGGYYASEKPWVAAIQRIVGVPPTGVFGPSTTAAVKKWQEAHHVGGAQTGKVGPLTWKAMGL